jgi:hypothetical protein
MWCAARVRLGVRSISVVVLAACVVACSAHPSGFDSEVPMPDAGAADVAVTPTLTCEWLRSADNCWLAALKEASGCLPDAKLAGALDATKTTCSYSNATVVTFSPYPATAVEGEAPAWKFDVTQKGIACLSFDSAAHPLGNHERTTLTTARGSVVLRYDDGAAQITCPDGRNYVHPRFHDLLGCEADVQTLPGEAWGSSGSLEYFWLMNGMGASNPNDHLTVWSCKS